MSKPVAWVPIHPRNGPLWAMATDKPDPERLPNSYPLRPLAFADEAQAAPAPEPSAQPVAGAVATEPSEEIQELRAQVEAWRKQCETLTNQVICCGVAARHPDATLTTRGAYAGKWNSPQAEEVRKLRAERDDLLAAAPQPAPSAQAVAHPSHQTVREWMPVSEALRLSDLWTAGDLDNCGQWRAAIKVLADEVRALAASPHPEPSAQGKPVACDRDAPVCPWCDRQGWDICQHADDARTCGK
jgi:hypothetical protein